MTPQIERKLRPFLLELVLYSVLAAVYFWVVLHWIGSWLNHLFHDDRGWYAGVALGLIVGQGFFLDLLSRLLFSTVGKRIEPE